MLAIYYYIDQTISLTYHCKLEFISINLNI
nr:MAG TPA: immunity protein [Crassvirales sp.]